MGMKIKIKKWINGSIFLLIVTDSFIIKHLTINRK